MSLPAVSGLVVRVYVRSPLSLAGWAYLAGRLLGYQWESTLQSIHQYYGRAINLDGTLPGLHALAAAQTRWWRSARRPAYGDLHDLRTLKRLLVLSGGRSGTGSFTAQPALTQQPEP